MKPKYHNIALQVGGSHYPTVGGDLLNQFGDAVVQECIATLRERTITDVHNDWEIGYNTALKKIESDLIVKFGVNK
jgi:hypothetical protein